MSLEFVLTAGRRAALARMTSRATIMRETGRMVQDEATGLEIPEWATVNPDSPFRLDGSSSGDGGSRTVTIAGVTYEQATGAGHLPHDQRDLRDDDLLLVTVGEWVGSVYRVIEAVKGDQKTARRVPVVEVDQPEEWA